MWNTDKRTVETRTPSKDKKPRTEPLGRLDARDDAQDRTSVYTIASARDASGELRRRRPRPAPPRGLQPIRLTMTDPAPIALGSVDDRRRLDLERDLHDGVQNELVALIVKLARAQDDPENPSALVPMFAELEAHAQAALDSVRNIARGIYPPLLADFGLREALRANAERVAIGVGLVGTAPRSTEQAEEAVYFSCSEAIQNAAKHAGDTAQVTVSLAYNHETLLVRIADDGRGFDPARAPEGAGLRNIRDRIEAVGGSFEVASLPGFGTVVTISLRWPAAADGRR